MIPLLLIACATPSAPALEACDGVDNDGDGLVDEGSDRDGDGYLGCTAAGAEADCDDADPRVHPGAYEVCDGGDSDCDGFVPADERDVDRDGTTTCQGDCDDTDELANLWDLDGDGVTACAGDCDDTDPDILPTAPERCNGQDDDCSGTVPTAEVDVDGDGQSACSGDCDDLDPAFENLDQDADGHATCGEGDCDDHAPTVHPGAAESCNGVDDDCDGVIDEAGSIGASPFYEDRDGDGYGREEGSRLECAAPAGTTATPGDCDDDAPAVHPAQAEDCDGIDNDCDGSVDESWPTTTWYPDADGDGYGDRAASVHACYPPAGHLPDGTDCDDADPAVHPTATETCDGRDDDCDGVTDEADSADATVWYEDDDADGWGDVPAPGCTQPPDTSTVEGDCDDARADRYPGAPEHCDGVDEDCDGRADNSPMDGVAWHPDEDEDRFGDASQSETTCTAPTGWIAEGGDCDDTAFAINPDAVETCDGLDEDCDGVVDDGRALCGTVTDPPSAVCGEAPGDHAGTGLAGLGDLDGDGYDEIAVGAPGNAAVSAGAGAVYVVRGPPAAGLWTLDRADARWLGVHSAAGAGWDVRNSDDMDGDGLGELLVAAPGDATRGLSATVVPGSAGLSGGSLGDDGNTQVVGPASGDGAGASVASAGDLDGDGLADLLVSVTCCGPDAPASGTTYLFYAAGLGGRLPLDDADARWLSEQPTDLAGFRVSPLGDFTGDGRDDFVIGAPGSAAGGEQAGAAYVIAGRGAPFSGVVALESSALTLLGPDPGDAAGTDVSGPGDIDGDGRDDLLVGAPGLLVSGAAAGGAWLYLGTSSTGTYELSRSRGAAIVGVAEGDRAGVAVAGAGDVNGDDRDDLLVGAPGRDGGAGAAYVLFGPVSSTVGLADSPALLLGRSATAGAGSTVAPAGDLDGAARSSILIGAPGDEAEAGCVYIYRGD